MNDNSTKAGTIGGTMLTVLWVIEQEDIVKTGVMAVIGAAVSFTVSLVLKWVVKKIRERMRG